MPLYSPSEDPFPALLKWLELILVVFEAVMWCSFPLGKAGKGLADGWCAPLATL